MLVKLGSVLAEARGSVGGATFARNRYGAYVRNRTKPVDPGTSKQVLQRGRMSASVENWRALTAAQRNVFNAKALITNFTNRLGEPFHPTGMNLFTRSDNLLALVNLPGITIPPVTPILQDYGAKARFTGGVGLEHLSETGNWPADAKMLILWQLNMTNSQYYYKGPYTNLTSQIAVDYTAGVFLLLADGSVAADSAQGVAWRLVGSDGAASAIGRMRTYKPPA